MVRRPLVRIAVIKAVPESAVGAYYLGVNSTPMPKYVGRSDTSLRHRLLNHASAGEFHWFSPVVAPDVYHAFRSECAGWHLLKRLGGDREMVDILSLVLQHDEQAVLCAVEMALEAGVPAKTHILNLLHRLVDGKSPAPDIAAPQALSLRNEPEANVERYDALRSPITARRVRHAS